MIIIFMSFFDFLKKEGKHEKRFKDLNKNLDSSFSNIRKDMDNFGKWVMHLENHRTKHHSKIEDLEKRIYLLEKMLENVNYAKDFVQTPILFKHKQTSVRLKQTSVGVQTGVYAVQTPVQTGIQTNVGSNFDKNPLELEQLLRSLTVMERAVLWTLLNTDMKMSYNDLSILLGKDKSTLRGQINNIKRKSESLISEFTEINGTKRFYVEESVKKMVIKSIKREPTAVQTSDFKKKKRKSES